ncbi:MAG: phosphatidylinositol-specific phospholipase C/glycerophosphodiester phosphodiesterase family protein [Zavarzinella sp.]
MKIANYVYICLFLFSANAAVFAQVVPLRQAHAHNDYEHPRPLLDALDAGFGSVEADIFLVDGKLLVGHTPFSLKPERTLQKLYLDPLTQRAKLNHGKIYKELDTFYLMIDIKTDAAKTYAALAKVLEGYSEQITTIVKGKVSIKAITVILSGNRDVKTIRTQERRLVAIDGRPDDLDDPQSRELIPWVSARWGSMFRWNGTGPIPEDQLKQLNEYVTKAHEQGRMVRFWAIPDPPTAWKTLLDAKVDLINTDKLTELSDFLRKRSEKSEK